MKNVHLVSDAEIQTHDLLNKSHLPQTLGQGSHPCYLIIPLKHFPGFDGFFREIGADQSEASVRPSHSYFLCFFILCWNPVSLFFPLSVNIPYYVCEHPWYPFPSHKCSLLSLK